MKKIQLFLFCFIIAIGAFQIQAQKVYQWRGENRQGKYNESNLLDKWPEKGPDLLWFTEEIGQGYGAPLVTADKVLVNGEADSTSYVFAFDLQGKLLWKTPNGKEFYGKEFTANFPGSRSTPTVVGDLVYTSSGRGRLTCLELATGKEKWAIDMQSQFGGLEQKFGYSESPLIDGDIVYFMPGGPVNNMVALNRNTGKTVWTSKAMGDTTSFCSPIIVKLSSRKVLVNLSTHAFFGLDAQNGELLWSSKNIENYKFEGLHCNTPVFANGFLYISADEAGNGTIKLQISDDGKSIKEIWRNKNLSNAYGGFVELDNQLFLTNKQKKLLSANVNNGNIIDSLSSTKGGLIYADKLFYCYNESGDMKLIKYEGNKFAEISKFKIDKGTKEHFAHPVIANGSLYIRHGKALMAYNIKKP